MKNGRLAFDKEKLISSLPVSYTHLDVYKRQLENHYHDMQDMEFTVENKKLYMLQCLSLIHI